MWLQRRPLALHGAFRFTAMVALPSWPQWHATNNPGAAPIDVLMTGGHGEYFFGSFDQENVALGEIVSIKPAAN